MSADEAWGEDDPVVEPVKATPPPSVAATPAPNGAWAAEKPAWTAARQAQLESNGVDTEVAIARASREYDNNRTAEGFPPLPLGLEKGPGQTYTIPTPVAPTLEPQRPQRPQQVFPPPPPKRKSMRTIAPCDEIGDIRVGAVENWEGNLIRAANGNPESIQVNIAYALAASPELAGKLFYNEFSRSA
jgi:hypothetical protein